MNTTLLTRTGTVLAAGIIALTAYAALDDLSLKRKPKVGDVSEFKVSAAFQTDQGEVLFGQKRVEQVTELKSDGGFVEKITSSETKISFGGQDLPEQPAVTGSAEVGPDGLIKTVTSDEPTVSDPANLRLYNLHAFKAPDGAVKVGDEIKFDIPADTKKGTPGVKCTYKVAGSEKVKDWDCAKLTFTAEETEGEAKSSIKGTAWISTADGSLVKSEEQWKDVQPAGAPFPVNGKYTVERVK